MKKVEPILTIEEFGKKAETPLKAEIKRAIDSCKDVVDEKLKVVSSTWYKVTKWLFLILGIIFAALGGAFYSSHLMRNMLYFGVVSIIIGIIMFRVSSSKYRSIDNIYREAMDLDKIYETTINCFPNFKYVASEEGATENLVKLTYAIPRKANLESASRCFKVLFKDKYEVEFQSGKFHWVTYTRDSKGNTIAHNHYADSGFATIQFDQKESDHEFTMYGGNVFGESEIKKVDLENRNFLKYTNFKSNNPIKARMMFTPLAMEETLKLQEQIIVPFNLSKIGDVAYFTYAALSSQFLVDARYDKDEEQTIEYYFVDIIADFYRLYEMLGTVMIPPAL